MRVAHLISSIEAGGAEHALCTLVEETRAAGVRHTVVSMLPGSLHARLERAGAAVIVLNARRGPGGALALAAVARALRSARPDLVHGWMYHANIAASVIALAGRVRAPVVWGIRQSADDISLDRRSTRLVIRAGAAVSAHPGAIAYNSEQAAQTHERLGYARKRRIVIPNGIDCRRFQPCQGARERLCAELGLPRDVLLIGRVARYASMKDYPTLLRAFAMVLATHPGARLVLAGQGVAGDNRELVQLCRDLGCSANVHLLGPREDVEMLYCAFDVLVSSSKANEGFPNTVAEALACGTPVVSTSVGDPALIRTGCQFVVPPSRPEALAAGIISLVGVSQSVRRDQAVRGRNFILHNFDTRTFAARFLQLYREARDRAHADPAC
jgi:glycosyltransferase involved in cell wall biosynthesis